MNRETVKHDRNHASGTNLAVSWAAERSMSRAQPKNMRARKSEIHEAMDGLVEAIPDMPVTARLTVHTPLTRRPHRMLMWVWMKLKPSTCELLSLGCTCNLHDSDSSVPYSAISTRSAYQHPWPKYRILPSTRSPEKVHLGLKRRDRHAVARFFTS